MKIQIRSMAEKLFFLAAYGNNDSYFTSNYSQQPFNVRKYINTEDWGLSDTDMLPPATLLARGYRHESRSRHEMDYLHVRRSLLKACGVPVPPWHRADITPCKLPRDDAYAS